MGIWGVLIHHYSAPRSLSTTPSTFSMSSMMTISARTFILGTSLETCRLSLSIHLNAERTRTVQQSATDPAEVVGLGGVHLFTARIKTHASKISFAIGMRRRSTLA